MFLQIIHKRVRLYLCAHLSLIKKQTCHESHTFQYVLVLICVIRNKYYYSCKIIYVEHETYYAVQISLMYFHNIAVTHLLCNIVFSFQSKYFKISRSMRQGCPISPLIYILQAEPLACAIRCNNKIKGYPLPFIYTDNTEIAEVKINGFADDTQLFNITEDSITECFKTLEKYEKASGAIIHKTKTTGLYTGPWKYKEPEYKEIKWTKQYIKTLGIMHGYEIDENELWMEKINKIKNCIQVWKNRDLTFKGKILIIKTLLISQIGFETETRIVPKYVIKTINNLIWSFLWNNKQPTVNRNVMCLEQLQGGQNMINLDHFIEAKRIKSIYKIIHSECEHWNMTGKYWLQSLDEKYNTEYFLCKCSSTKNLNLNILPKYYKESLTAWTRFQSKCTITNIDTILGEYLCGNTHILYRNAPLWFNSFCRSGLKTIEDIWNKESKSFHEDMIIFNKLTDKTNWRTQLMKIKNGIPVDWVQLLTQNDTTCSHVKSFYVKSRLNFNDLKHELINPRKVTLKQIQNVLNNPPVKPKSEIKWNETFNTDLEWKNIWERSLYLPCSQKEKQFHWRIIHNALFTEHRLHLMGMSDGICHFCKRDTETVSHLFYYCGVVKESLTNIELILNSITMYSAYLSGNCYP